MHGKLIPALAGLVALVAVFVAGAIIAMRHNRHSRG